MNPLFSTLIGLLSFAACAGSAKKEFSSPPPYNLNQPEKFMLPDNLQEISGITFPPGAGDTIYAQQDEDGRLFYFMPGDQKILDVRFGKKGDYEDIAISNGLVVILRSDGTFHTFPFAERPGEKIMNAQEQKGLLPKGEYESLASAGENMLYVLCKVCNTDKKKTQTSGYFFKLDTDGTIIPQGNFAMDNQQIERFASLHKQGFRPSALTRNTRTGEWYILSSINKLLVVTDAQWKVKAAYPLNPDLFIQPEGIAFDHDNNLYISNEAGNKQYAATLLKFKYRS